MNELNYSTLEASKRLVEAGIELKTDFCWIEVKIAGKEIYVLRPFQQHKNHGIPAPTMVEAWRALPQNISMDNTGYILVIEKLKNKEEEDVCCVDYEDEEGCTNNFFTSKNPTDALIDLLICVSKLKENGL